MLFILLLRSCWQLFQVVKAETNGAEVVGYALSPTQLQRHSPVPAGYQLSGCASSSTVQASHPPGVSEQAFVSNLLVRNPAVYHRTFSWLTQGREWRFEAWALDDQDLEALEWIQVDHVVKVLRAPLPPTTRLYQWIKTQLQRQHGINHGITLSRVEVVKSPVTLGAFNYRLQQTAARLTANHTSNPFLKAWPEDETKTEMLKNLERQFASSKQDGVRVLPLWHGCSVPVADEIMSKGIANLSNANFDFFGPGIYFTAQPEYAAGYASGVIKDEPATPTEHGEFVILLCAVCVGSVYPITRTADYPSNGNECKFRGRILEAGYDAHYALVDVGTGWQAAKADQPLQCHFEELVVEQDAQVLPIAKVYVRADVSQQRSFLTRILTRPLAYASQGNVMEVQHSNQ